VAYNLTTFIGAADLRTLSAGEVKQDIIDDTYQDGPFDLLKPAFNLTLCKTNSLVVYSNLKTLVVKLASDTVHKQLFAVLVPSYSMESQTVLDYIWQSYFDEKGVAVRLSAQVYYSTFLNTIRLFYDLEEYPLDIARIFMAHIDSTYTKGFCARYPSHGQAPDCLAITQRCILTGMLQELIRAKTEVSNILDIVHVNQRGGEQFYQTTPATPAFPSLAKRRIKSYTRTDDVTKSTTKSKEWECFGCRGPHP
jgi:hypothetical protein